MLKNNEFFNKLMYKLGDYVIRQCDKNDIKEVIDINWKTLPEHYTEYFFIDILNQYPETFLVSEHAIDGNITGYIMCRIEYGVSNFRKLRFARKGHIISVAVLDKYRGKGIGKTLVLEALKSMKERKCSEVYLEVRRTNLEAIGLYNKLDFTHNMMLERYYQDGEAASLMVKELSE